MCGGELILDSLSLALSILALACCKARVELPEFPLAKKREKVRKRYVLMHVLAERPEALERKCLEDCLANAVRNWFGEVGLALAEPRLVYFDLKSKHVIIRCNYDAKEVLIASTIEPVKCCGTELKFVPLRAFGTLRAARDAIPKLSKG